MTDRHDRTLELSAWRDGELPPDEAAELEAHLASCAECRAALADLEALVAAAPDYRGAPPRADLWDGIAAQIEADRVVEFTGGAPVRRRWSWPARIAAAVGLMALGAGGALWLSPGTGGVAVPTPQLVEAPAQDRMELANAAYQAAVADLSAALESGRDRLAPETIAVIERNLAVIDQAIAESEAALAADPANAELRGWIAANQRRKLDLLRRAAQAVAEASAS